MFVLEGFGNPTNSGHGEARCPRALAWSIAEPRVRVAQPAAGAAPKPGPRGARSPHPLGLRDGGRGSGAAPPPTPPTAGSQCRWPASRQRRSARARACDASGLASALPPPSVHRPLMARAAAAEPR
uniref:Uncharacterized protein n=1 Tax=Rangifer tarandus platyrhynchus TaxID=3082113 RepID=A0ACB0ETF1_RANTA|nr:unnamed protein product [Rangifer tarandus platyrhynchus]